MEVKRLDEVSIPCLLPSVSVTMCQVKADVLFRSSSLLLHEQLFLFRPCRSDSQMAGIMTPESLYPCAEQLWYLWGVNVQCTVLFLLLLLML